ncbi:MAG: UDP-N-acetylmuramoyl-tripeptide--D-alanyl-D-alanine ligase, partial [Sandarakinorhabdus sp.]|nr:UDP-N-acetylmuramoyl-tripeptide--D-alanyl-D-alanine ligase [Sandarakinorhabdus sp.]
GTAHGDFTASNVTFDSREVIGGELFVAMQGAAMDGHRFVAQAIDRGAAGLLVTQPVAAPHVLVADTMAGLQALGAAARDRTAALRIGVTGSVGKTGVKEAIKASLARFAPGAVHASVKSYNNHTGVPLSLSRMPRDSRFGIFEMGMNHEGEIAALTAQVRPAIALVTWVASAHIENFADEAGIADAKGEIFKGLQPGGTAIIPFDNLHRDRLIGHARGHADRIITFGINPGADVVAETFVLHPDCSCVTARVGAHRLTFKVGMAGRHWVGNALAVLAAVDAAGGDLALAGLALGELTDLPGRGQRLRVATDTGPAIVIDESYNANPESMAASLAVLADITPAGQGRRIALLGAMRELGDRSDAFHADLAPHLVAAGVSAIILVGNEMKPLATALSRRVEVLHVADAPAAQIEIDRLLGRDDVVLVKGSNSVRLGDVVAHLRSRETGLRHDGRPGEGLN